MKKTSIRIGRDPSCEMPVADDSISRVHAEVELTPDGKLTIVDCNSSNGTFVFRDGQKQRITRATVAAGERVSFGDCQFEVSELIEDVRARSPQWLQGQAGGPRAPVPDPKAKRIRCSECGFVKVQGEACPRCASMTRRND